jgi:hypothetical protein
MTATGALTHGSGVTSAGLLATGSYDVIFDQNVTACAYDGTSTNIGGAPAMVQVAPLGTNAGGVRILTIDTTGTPVNTSFDLAVFC